MDTKDPDKLQPVIYGDENGVVHIGWASPGLNNNIRRNAGQPMTKRGLEEDDTKVGT